MNTNMTESEAIEEMSHYSEEEYGKGAVAESHKMAIIALEEIQQYRAIGTVEELRELKEKHEPIKAIGGMYSWDCPRCGTFHSTNGKYCSECGQAVELD